MSETRGAENGAALNGLLGALGKAVDAARAERRATANEETPNPYDHEDACRCFAYSEGECACGGYVDRGKVRAWRQGYDAAVRDIGTLREE